MKELFYRNYEAVKNRGLLNENVLDTDFLRKLREETNEVANEIINNNDVLLCNEVADCLIVCSNWLIFRGVDLTEILTKVAEKNEKRAIK